MDDSSAASGSNRLSPALLIRAVQELSTARDLSEIIAIAKHSARTGCGADGVSFVLRDGDMCHYADEESIAPLWKGRRFPMSACVSGWTMLHREPAAIPDITLDSRIPQDAYRATFVRSLLMVPIRNVDPIGAIGAYWATVQNFTPGAVRWLQALADATSAGMEAIRAKDEVAALRQQTDSESRPGEFVHMCAWTRRIFWDNEWISIEAFLAKRYGVTVSHGISEDVARIVKRGTEGN